MNCPVCQAPLEGGPVCSRCGWDTSADPRLYPTLFSPAGMARAGEAEAERLYAALGRLLFGSLPPEDLRACLEAGDPAAAARALLDRKPPSKPAVKPGNWRKNVLASGAFDQAFCRKVKTIRFRDTLSGLPADARDLSRDQNGSVMAYLGKGACLTVCGEGGICAPADCRSLFWDLQKLQTVEFGGCFHTEDCRNMAGMFKNCTALEAVDLRGFDTAKVTDMNSMFYGCAALTGLDLRDFETARVTDMSFMFCGCGRLWKLSLGSGFRTGQTVSMRSMFNGCAALEAVELKRFDTSRVSDMSRMFASCSSLQELDVSGFNTAQVTDMNSMFKGCSSLRNLDVRGFDTARVSDMSKMLAGCVSLSRPDTSGFVIARSCSTLQMFSDVPE